MAVLGHAIVMGGGVAGLLAAAALAEHSVRVTVVDRDPLPVDGPEALAPRRGVPQGGTVHRLLAVGEARIEQLLPGVREDLLAAGAAPRATAADAAPDLGIDTPGTLWLTRPLLEGVLRRRVLALPGVESVQGAVGGLLTAEDGRTVTGVSLRGGETPELHGDLVVDAAGRSSRAGSWMPGLGAERPRTLGTRVHVAYTCQRLRLPGDALPAGLEALSLPPSEAVPFTIDLEPCGGDHLLAVAGTSRHQPPTDRPGLLDLVAQLPASEDATALGRALEVAEPVGEPSSAKAAGAHRQLWEAVADAPEGLVHVGDAAAMFTPLYGQGMAMAAVGAVALRDHVAALGSADEAGAGAADGAADGTGTGAADGLAAPFQRALADLLDTAWESTLARDLRLPGAERLLDGAVVEELPDRRDLAPALSASR